MVAEAEGVVVVVVVVDVELVVPETKTWNFPSLYYWTMNHIVKQHVTLCLSKS